MSAPRTTSNPYPLTRDAWQRYRCRQGGKWIQSILRMGHRAIEDVWLNAASRTFRSRRARRAYERWRNAVYHERKANHG